MFGIQKDDVETGCTVRISALAIEGTSRDTPIGGKLSWCKLITASLAEVAVACLPVVVSIKSYRYHHHLTAS